MALTYSWELTSLKKTNTANISNVIVGTQWKLTGTDDAGDSGSFNGATPFKAEDVDLDSFVEYDTLTANTVLSWIQSVVVGGYKDHIDEQIQKQIDVKKNPIEEVSGNTFPWSV